MVIFAFSQMAVHPRSRIAILLVFPAIDVPPGHVRLPVDPVTRTLIPPGRGQTQIMFKFGSDGNRFEKTLIHAFRALLGD